jgi:D-alanyl-D-alanine carboxypeptidase (penicillin-binding protein 5/6)
VREGQDIGVLQISAGDRVVREVPLVAAASVEKGGLVSQAADAMMELMFFWL